MKTIKMWKRGEVTVTHPYPHNLQITTQKKIQGVITYLIILDHSAHLYFKDTPNAWEKLIGRLNDVGFKEGIDDESWNDFSLYIQDTPPPLVQQLIINIEFALDRYLHGIGEFIQKANDALQIRLEKKDQNILQHIHVKPIKLVIEFIDKNIGTTSVTENEIISLQELSNLRNLGAHNEWIVDQKYLDLTKSPEWVLGGFRQVEIVEVISLYRDILSVLTKLSNQIGLFYKDFKSEEFD